MIGQKITGKNGNPITSNGNTLTTSKYQPNAEVKGLFSRVQQDYQVSYNLQHRGFNEFDGYSLLTRTLMDQELFGTFVGAEWVAPEKRWRWRGRKNTARNKIMGILAHMVAGMLYPFVHAKNSEGEEDELAAKVMRILVEDSLRKAKYEIKFMHMALSALVNPAVIVNVEFVEAMQRIKVKMASGEYEVKEVVDELLSGLNLNIVPVDELLLADFYSGGDIQRQPYIIRVRRISYEDARAKYAGKYTCDGKDAFEFVQAGMTRVMLAGQENQTLFDIEWTEADPNFVQELTVFYRQEDLQATFVGGVFMGNEVNVYNTNPFTHRRMQIVDDDFCMVPVYPYAMSGFEPIDPTGRFSYYKSAAFKEFWDDKALNYMHKLAIDGTSLDVMKPIFLTGIAGINSDVLAPGAVTSLPNSGSDVKPFMLGPNLKATYDSIETQRRDMSESTQDPIMSGQTEKGVTKYATQQAEQNARIFLGNFGTMISELVKSVGELAVDIQVQFGTKGQLDATVPGRLKLKFKTRIIKEKNKGRTISNQVVFTDEMMGREYTDEQIKEKSWELYDKTGDTPKDRETSEKRIFMVNPKEIARRIYALYVDPDMIVRKSAGIDKQEKLIAFNIMTDPRVVPFTDQKAVIDDFAIEEYGGEDPDKYKKKDTGQDDMLNQMMMAGKTPPVNGLGSSKPMNTNQINQPEMAI